MEFRNLSLAQRAGVIRNIFIGLVLSTLLFGSLLFAGREKPPEAGSIFVLGNTPFFVFGEDNQTRTLTEKERAEIKERAGL